MEFSRGPVGFGPRTFGTNACSAWRPQAMLSPLVGRRLRRIVTSRRPCSSCSQHRLLALRMRSRARRPRYARRPPSRPRPRSAVTGPWKLQLHRQHPLRRSITRNGPLTGRDRASQSRRSLRCMTPEAPGPMHAQGYEEGSLWSCTSLSPQLRPISHPRPISHLRSLHQNSPAATSRSRAAVRARERATKPARDPAAHSNINSQRADCHTAARRDLDSTRREGCDRNHVRHSGLWPLTDV